MKYATLEPLDGDPGCPDCKAEINVAGTRLTLLFRNVLPKRDNAVRVDFIAGRETIAVLPEFLKQWAPERDRYEILTPPPADYNDRDPFSSVWIRYEEGAFRSCMLELRQVSNVDDPQPGGTNRVLHAKETG